MVSCPEQNLKAISAGLNRARKNPLMLSMKVGNKTNNLYIHDQVPAELLAMKAIPIEKSKSLGPDIQVSMVGGEVVISN